MRVDLGDRGYEVKFGKLRELGPSLVEVIPARRVALVTNDVVGPLHGDTARASLEGAGLEVRRFQLPDGERLKTLDTWRGLVESLLGWPVDRHTAVVALGGGVTGDIAGFAAATTLRGLPLVQVPTTLLAMVDSSVGGKTGVNTVGGKNLIGAFYQPRLVLAALDTLATLSDEEYRCGLGEVVKHAVIDGPLFAWLEGNVDAVLSRDPGAVLHMVERCCAIKADIVRQDERESGVRALLNCGHTLGHAIEHVLGFGTLRHGEAVAIGLVGEATIAVQRGEAAADLPERITSLLTGLGLPSRCAAAPEALVAASTMDKKRVHGSIWIAYPSEIGRVRLAEVEPAELLDAAIAVSIPPEDAP